MTDACPTDEARGLAAAAAVPSAGTNAPRQPGAGRETRRPPSGWRVRTLVPALSGKTQKQQVTGPEWAPRGVRPA